MTGDVIRGLAEQHGLVAGMTIATLLTLAAVLAALLLYFRSLAGVLALGWSLTVGALVAFAFTELTIGHLNIASAFLSSIVIGNGINFGIIYLGRYFEERRAGHPVERSLRDRQERDDARDGGRRAGGRHRLSLPGRHALSRLSRLRDHRRHGDGVLLDLGLHRAAGGPRPRRAPGMAPGSSRAGGHRLVRARAADPARTRPRRGGDPLRRLRAGRLALSHPPAARDQPAEHGQHQRRARSGRRAHGQVRPGLRARDLRWLRAGRQSPRRGRARSCASCGPRTRGSRSASGSSAG